MTAFNEDSRVKIPALLHLARLGYGYLSLKTAQWDARNNLFTEVFADAILRINPTLQRADIPALIDKIQLSLAGEDEGKRAFMLERLADAQAQNIKRKDLPQWLEAGAKLIGGCCRTTPKDIAELNAQR